VLSMNPALVEIETADTQSLLDRAQAGDAEAFGEICRIYETRLLRQAMTFCGNVALAEDLAQDTLVEGWKCLRRYNGRCRFFTWLCAILLNRYRNNVREKRPLAVSSLAGGDLDQFQNSVDNMADHGSLPDQAAALLEQAALMRKCIETLPIKHQQVIYLRFYVDNSLAGIAAALDCSVGTVKSRLFHALDKLRRMDAVGAQFANINSKTGVL
jgi:RNA polymerase sigma-70 factor, ECF subfamily